MLCGQYYSYHAESELKGETPGKKEDILIIRWDASTIILGTILRQYRYFEDSAMDRDLSLNYKEAVG